MGSSSLETEETGFFFWRGVRESCCLLLLSLRWFEPKVSNRARQIRIKDSRIPLNTVAARKGKAGRVLDVKLCV